MKRAKAAAVAGAIGCVACCAAPILLAAGLIGAGLAAAVAAWLPWQSALLIVGALVTLVAHERRKAASCVGNPTHADNCGCQPAATSNSAPTLNA